MATDKLSCLIGSVSKTVKRRGQNGSSQSHTSRILWYAVCASLSQELVEWTARAENASYDYIVLHKVKQSKIYG